MKKIIHIDADCFYASVEMRENPRLIHAPIAVGGDPQKRGVIATCNYEARRFGVRSAMSSATAVRCCPHLQILPPRISLYKEYSAVMMAVFSAYTDKIEPLSLDEAYLDVSAASCFHGSATLIANDIRQKVRKKLGITVSAGVAPAKYLAKIASDWRKPDGVFTLAPPVINSFVSALPVSKLPGVGPVTTSKLARQGIYTCDDIKKCGVARLFRYVGASANRLYDMSLGVDNTEVASSSERKNISVEHTYERDLQQFDVVVAELDVLISRLCQRYEERCHPRPVKSAFVKLKFCNFETTTAEGQLKVHYTECFELLYQLLRSAWQRKEMPVRLIGVGFRLKNGGQYQLSLPFC